MGTQAAPNLVITIINMTTGNPDTGETVEIVPYGSIYPANKIALTEIGVTGRYKKETGSGVAAVNEGSYQVYVGGTFRGIFIHGGEFLSEHRVDLSDPHQVSGAQVSITDSGSYFSGTSVEAALQEIGQALTAFASNNNSLLLNATSQNVNSGKPKVGNLDADKVDGKHVGTSDGNIPEIGAGAGKLDSTLLNKKVGSGNDNIPQISTDATPDTGKVHSSILAKKVGSGNDNIPQISTDANPAAGKLHNSLLGKKNTDIGEYERTASYNTNDNPAPDATGALKVWVDGWVGNNTTPILLDNTYDWRNRWIFINGYLYKGDVNHEPGGSSQTVVNSSQVDAAFPMNKLDIGFYSHHGSTGHLVAPFVTAAFTGANDDLYFWVDEATGGLYMVKDAFTNSTVFSFGFKIEASPPQNH